MMDNTGQQPSRRQARPGAWKAINLLNALDGPALEKLVQYFDRDDLARIRAMDMDLQPVAAEEFTAILEEFANRFVRRLHMVGKARAPEGILEEALSPEELNKLSGAGQDAPAPVWDDERFASPDILAPMAGTEHPQVMAFLLSRLDAEASARVIRMLEDAIRGEILLRMLDMHPVSDSVTMVIEQHIRISFIEDASAARNAEARARIAGIVNRMDKELAEQFLRILKEERPEDAKELKRMLFSFEDIAKLEKKDQLVLFDRAPVELTVKALHHAPQELTAMVLEALGGRMRKMVEAELQSGNAPDEAESRDAQQQIAALALELSKAGEIVINTGDED
jgi:flagellar motor switch protein FliG